jgi:hypothetical protein
MCFESKGVSYKEGLNIETRGGFSTRTMMSNDSKPSTPWRTASESPASIELWITPNINGKAAWKVA